MVIISYYLINTLTYIINKLIQPGTNEKHDNELVRNWK